MLINSINRLFMYHVEPILGQDLDLRVFRVFVKKGNSVKPVTCPRPSLGLIINDTFISIIDLGVLFIHKKATSHGCPLLHDKAYSCNYKWEQHSCCYDKNTFVS